jgi:hypothetical protein
VRSSRIVASPEDGFEQERVDGAEENPVCGTGDDGKPQQPEEVAARQRDERGRTKRPGTGETVDDAAREKDPRAEVDRKCRSS